MPTLALPWTLLAAEPTPFPPRQESFFAAGAVSTLTLSVLTALLILEPGSLCGACKLYDLLTQTVVFGNSICLSCAPGL